MDAVDESYQLNISSNGVALSAKTVWGAKHGLDTLAQLVAGPADLEGGAGPDTGARASSLVFHQAAVEDHPEYGYRGLMLSPGQRFIPLPLLTSFLDGMEVARLNVLCAKFRPAKLGIPPHTFFVYGIVSRPRRSPLHVRTYRKRLKMMYNQPDEVVRNAGEQALPPVEVLP